VCTVVHAASWIPRHEDGAVEVGEPQDVLEDGSETILSEHDVSFTFVEVLFQVGKRAARIVSADTLAPVPVFAHAARAWAADRRFAGSSHNCVRSSSESSYERLIAR